MAIPTIENYSEIRKNRDEILLKEKLIREKKCFIYSKVSSHDCWCRKASPDGNDLPCPSPPVLENLG